MSERPIEEQESAERQAQFVEARAQYAAAGWGDLTEAVAEEITDELVDDVDGVRAILADAIVAHLAELILLREIGE